MWSDRDSFLHKSLICKLRYLLKPFKGSWKQKHSSITYTGKKVILQQIQQQIQNYGNQLFSHHIFKSIVWHCLERNPSNRSKPFVTGSGYLQIHLLHFKQLFKILFKEQKNLNIKLCNKQVKHYSSWTLLHFTVSGRNSETPVWARWTLHPWDVSYFIIWQQGSAPKDLCSSEEAVSKWCIVCFPKRDHKSTHSGSLGQAQ